jgi:hypothetical protein
MRAKKKLRFVRVSLGTLLLATVLFALVCSPSVVFAQESDAALAITAAQSKLMHCFDAARSAESAGANISSLTSVLNNAGSLLSDAKFAYSQGDFALASSHAAQSQSSLGSLVSDADALKSNCLSNANLQDLIFYSSIIGTFVVIGGGAAVWVIMKRKYGDSGA